MTAATFWGTPCDSFKKMSQKKKDKQITVLNTKSVFKLYSQEYTSSPSPCKEKARNRNILFSIKNWYLDWHFISQFLKNVKYKKRFNIYQETPSVSTTLDAQAWNVFVTWFYHTISWWYRVDIPMATKQAPSKKITTILIYFCTPALASQLHQSKMIQLISSTPHDIQNVKT